MISFIVVNYNTKNLLKNLLNSIKKFFEGEEVIVVDNASSDGSADMVSQAFPYIRLIANKDNIGFARANNQAMEIAKGDVFVLINSDAELIDDSLEQAVSLVSDNKEYGLVGCKLLNSNGSTQVSVARFPGIMQAFLSNTGLGLLLPSSLRGRMLARRYFDYTRQSDVDWVMGACMILRRDVYLKVGGMNTHYFMFGEDMEWCYRIKKAGYRIIYTPSAIVVHHFNKSSASNVEKRYELMYKNYYLFCNTYLGRTRSNIIRLLNIQGLLLRYAVYKLGLIKTNDPFLSYWFSNFKQALKAQFRS
ncbi:MAG: glycosyltransferase family 2 protein [bacterium]